MNIFSSLLVVRDAASREVLAGFGIDLRSPTAFDDLFNVLGRLDGVRCTWAKIASYRMTVGALSGSIGRFLREAACGSQLEIVFDWCSHRHYGGITQELVSELSVPSVDGVVHGVRYAGTSASLFHPKLLLIGLALPSGEQLRLVVLGSANMTAGGLRRNTELGVVFAERVLSSQRAVLGWPEVYELFEGWKSQAKPLTVEDLERLPVDSDELHEWTETGLPASLRLRPYQQAAVDAIVRAWEGRYQKRPSANWKGTLLVLPPATGKTLCALAAACRILERDELSDPVVWLSGGPLLAKQAYDEFQRTGFLQRRAIGLLVEAGRIRRSTGTDDMGDSDERSLDTWLNKRGAQKRPAILFTTKGDKRSLSAFSSKSPGLTIVDEAHHATAPGWNDALTGLRSYLVVGLTATPYRKYPRSEETRKLLCDFSVGSQPWLECFVRKHQAEVRKAEGAEDKKIAYGQPVEAFYNKSFTGTELPVLSVPTFVPVSVVDATAGEPVVVRPLGNKPQRIRFFENPFSDVRDLRDLCDLVHKPEIVKAALDAIDQDACNRAKRASVDKRTTIVFARNIQHAKILQNQLKGKDVEPTLLHSQDQRTLQERHIELQHVRKVQGSVLVCVDMVVEGVDLPTADLLVMVRWTSSERLFWQMIGRGLRGPDIGGTKNVEIVTYKLQFGDASEDIEDTASVQTVDEQFLDAFGEHAKERLATLEVKSPGSGSVATKAKMSTDWAGGDRDSRQRRQGPMLFGDICHRESLDLDGNVFDIVIRTDSGTIVDQRDGVRDPWRVLRNLYSDGRRGRKYRFVVTGRDE